MNINIIKNKEYMFYFILINSVITLDPKFEIKRLEENAIL